MMRRILLLLAAGVLAVLSGCYHVGSLSHPQLRTVAVAPVINETTLFNASAIMRDLLCERFQLDGSLKLVDMSEADCIVYVRILSYTVSDSGDNNYNRGEGIYYPALWTLSMSVEYSVAIPGQATLLLSNRRTRGSAKFQKNIDQFLSREFGVNQAALAIADKIVSSTTEAW